MIPEKSPIYYHRSYRKLHHISKNYFIIAFLLLTALCDFIIILTYPKLTQIISNTAKYILSFSIPEGSIEIINKKFIYRNVYMLDLPGNYPSSLFSFVSAVISLLTMFLVPQIKRITKPVTIWIVTVSFINFVSSLFFIFLPDYFPYGVAVFSELYIKAEISIWLLIPLVMTIAIMPLPSKMQTKFAIIACTLSYSIIFGCLRYIVFLYLLGKLSYLFMALMFFIFGPLLDFIYVVGIYSYYVNIVSNQVKKDMKVWEWLF